MAKVKMMRRLRGRLYVYDQSRFLPDHWDERHASVYLHHTWHRSTEGARQDALLIKEIEETNNWGRLGVQLYFGWFALLFAANALGIFWLLARDLVLPPFSPLVFAVFFVADLTGIMANLGTRENLVESDLRIREVIETLNRHCVDEDPCSESQSPVPLEGINTAFRFTGTALVTLMLFWAALEIWWALGRLG